jgi:hypothetical protein
MAKVGGWGQNPLVVLKHAACFNLDMQSGKNQNINIPYQKTE